MSRTVRVVHERRRGCGYRKVGGLYLVSEGVLAPCGDLPIELVQCSACGGGIKPSRGWTWIEPVALLLRRDKRCLHPYCGLCPIRHPPAGRHGLLWIGEGFYPTPELFLEEVRSQGLCRRIPAVPRGLTRDTWIFLAHRRAVRAVEDGDLRRPGLFSAFRFSRIEKVVREDTPEEELEALRKRGIEPVSVHPIEESPDPPEAA